MLLFRKPLADIQIGESFQVTVTREDWARGTHPCDSNACALAQAIVRREQAFVAVGTNYAYIGNGGENRFAHDGYQMVSAFDRSLPFPGETIVTFTRES